MPRFAPLLRFAFLLAVALNLSSCASGSEAIARALKLAISRGSEADRVNLNPAMRYLRVSTEGRVAILALGYVEAHPEGNIEVWYSAQGEVIHLRNGRIMRTAGLATDWRDVRYAALPAWNAVGNTPIEIRRRRDEMPGYRMNIEETLELRAIASPSDSLLAGIDAGSLRWFEERQRPGAAWPLPPTRYAVRMADAGGSVVYAEQCLSTKLCLAWQRWPATGGTETSGATAN